MTTFNTVAQSMHTAWLNGSDDECFELASKLAAALDCNVYHLMTLLNNLDVVQRTSLAATLSPSLRTSGG